MSSPILGSRFCIFSSQCREYSPCARCLYIARTEKTVFTPAQEKEIDEFLDKKAVFIDTLPIMEQIPQFSPEEAMAIEEAAILSALNMGVPDWFWCGHCGAKFYPHEIVAHLEANSQGECANAQSEDSQT